MLDSGFRKKLRIRGGPLNYIQANVICALKFLLNRVKIAFFQDTFFQKEYADQKMN